jgi:lysophospholipase L1-like esterase
VALFRVPGQASRTCLSMLLVWGVAALALANLATALGAGVKKEEGKRWIGTWAAAPQPAFPGTPQRFRNQTLRLVVRTSAGGAEVRVKISNTYGDQPILIGAAHIARRTVAAEIDPSTDRVLTFQGQASTTLPARSMVVSDPVELETPALSDLAISLFFPETTVVATSHILAMQTSYVSAIGDSTPEAKFLVAKTIDSWPFLSGVDVAVSAGGAVIVAFGSSLTDGDGSTPDTNGRWPDALAERLQEGAGRKAEVGVLNEGIIGNRLLADSPQGAGSPFGGALGQAGLARFERDVLAQAGVQYVVVALGINDIAMPGSLTPAAEAVTPEMMIAGYRQLIARAHQKGIRVIGTTNPPFENSFLASPKVTFYTPEKESVRQKVNAWILSSGEFDAAVDFDAVVRDPGHPPRLLPVYDSGDHLHPNNAGYIASANAIPLTLFGH